MMVFQEYRARWRRHVNEIARSRYYAHVGRAETFVMRHLMPVWREEDAVVSDRAFLARHRMTRTQMQIVHLFARGVLGVASSEARAPRLECWPPSTELGRNGVPVCHRVIPTRHLAKILGRSISAVNEALRRFKRVGAVGCSLPAQGLWSVISMATGIALDGLLSPHACVPFMYAVHEYGDARAYAGSHNVHQGRFVERQRSWCNTALDVCSIRGLNVSADDAPAASLG